MSSFSIAEARNSLPRLVDRMLSGEEIVITRRGKAVARLVPQQAKITQPPADVEWLKRVRLKADGGPDSVALIRHDRDER